MLKSHIEAKRKMKKLIIILQDIKMTLEKPATSAGFISSRIHIKEIIL